ncbi:MAG: helix-turn-helix domain-containing protein [Pelovirga sp.]
MNFYVMSDFAIYEEIGRRFRETRLRNNMTQVELADRTQTSLTRIKALEKGHGKLETMILVLRELQALDHMDDFLHDPGISPIQIAKMRGKIKQRASGGRPKRGKID